jgi:hypothetical protein
VLVGVLMFFLLFAGHFTLRLAVTQSFAGPRIDRQP